MCLAGAVVASWSVTQGVAGSSPSNDKYVFVTEFTEFSGNISVEDPEFLRQEFEPKTYYLQDFC